MYCTKCGNGLVEKDLFCSECGEKTDSLEKKKLTQEVEQILVPKKEFCETCNNEKRNLYKNSIYTGKNICLNCNSKMDSCPICEVKLKYKLSEQCGNCNHSWHSGLVNPLYSESQKLESVKNNNKIQCPKCKSINIIGGKKGFSGAKAVGGAILTGGIGILAGTIGSNKVELSCLSCGNKFKPREDLRDLRKKKREQEEAMKSPVFLVFFIGLMILFVLLLKGC